MEKGAKTMLIDIFPETLNRTGVDESSIESMLHVLKEYFKNSPEETQDSNHMELGNLYANNISSDFKASHKRSRRASSRTPTQFMNEDAHQEQYILHELTHAFHLGSMVILTVLVLEVN